MAFLYMQVHAGAYKTGSTIHKDWLNVAIIIMYLHLHISNMVYNALASIIIHLKTIIRYL